MRSPAPHLGSLPSRPLVFSTRQRFESLKRSAVLYTRQRVGPLDEGWNADDYAETVLTVV